MASWSHETPLQLRIITCYVGFKSFWIPVSWNLNWRFSELLELSLGRFCHSCPGCCVHMYIVAGFWTLCQLWVFELSWEEFSTLVTGLHDPATCSWSNCLLDVVPVPRSATKMCLGECSATKLFSYAMLPRRQVMLSYQDKADNRGSSRSL